MASKYINKKIRIGMLGRPSPMKGCSISSDTKLKQSLAKKGRKGNASGFKHSEETKNKKKKVVIQTDIYGNVINEFNSVSETAAYFLVPIQYISKVLNKEKKYNNYIFKTKDNDK